MKYLSRFLVITFTLQYVLLVSGQRLSEPCYLGLANAPNIRGIKLGTSPAEVEKVLGLKILLEARKETSYYIENLKAPISAKNPVHKIVVNVGVKTFEFYAAKSNKIPAQLKGIDGLLLNFIDNSLYSIYVRYGEQDFDWKDSKEFALMLSENFNLPKESWWTKETGSFLYCSGFNISTKLHDNGNPVILLSVEKTRDLVEAKEKQAVADAEQKIKDSRSEKKKSFKP